MTFQNANGDAVVPELIVSSRNVHHTLLFEWKEGGNTEADQLQRYNGVIQQDLTQRAMLLADECTTHNVTIIGVNEFRERIARGVDDSGYTFPVLVVTNTGLELIRNAFSEPQTDAVFRPALNFDWNIVPTSFFPVDGTSELWEYAEQIIPWLLVQMEGGATRILAEDVAHSIIPLWDTANRNFKQQIEPKIVTVLTYASQNEFAPYIQRNRRLEGRTHSPTWAVIDNPLLNNPDKRLKIWHAMRNLQSAVIEHFRGSGVQEKIVWEEAEEASPNTA
jgi:hypothetical protein